MYEYIPICATKAQKLLTRLWDVQTFTIFLHNNIIEGIQKFDKIFSFAFRFIFVICGKCLLSSMK